jgi:DNA-binding XRE family transcriptional regulator
MRAAKRFSFLVSGFLFTPGILSLDDYILLIYHLDIMIKTSDIRKTRKQLNLSQEKLARLLNVSWITVNRWERGKPEPSFLVLKGIEAVLNENFEGRL